MVDVIISQGPADYFREVDAAWAGIRPVIHSTWIGEHKEGMKDFVLSPKPENPGKQNVWMQARTTLNGLRRARALGYKSALKLRSDMVPTNAAEFLKLLDAPLGFLFFHDFNGGYLVDYMQFGPIDLLIDLWSFTEEPPYPERGITKQFWDLKMHEMGAALIGGRLTEENDLIWLKRGTRISEYNNDPLFINSIS